jgi:hypothetical protein
MEKGAGQQCIVGAAATNAASVIVATSCGSCSGGEESGHACRAARCHRGWLFSAVQSCALCPAASSGGGARKKAFTVCGAEQGARQRHSGSPILQRYATTSVLLNWIAHFSAVRPSLQRLSERKMASARRAAAPGPRGDVCFRRHQQVANFQMALVSRTIEGSGLPKNKVN